MSKSDTPVSPKINIPLDFHLELKINGDTTFVVDSTDLYHLKKILDDHILKNSVGHHGFILNRQRIVYMYDIDIDNKKPFLIVNLIKIKRQYTSTH